MTSVAQSQSAIKTGAIRKGDQSVLLVSSYGKVERKLALDASRQSQSSVIGLFSRYHVGSLPSIRPGFNTEMRRYLSSVGLLKAFQSDTEEILSIVLSGRRKDDQDYGDWIVYTGTDDSSIGSKDEEEMHDQTLEGLNLMLAHCCAAPINTKRGSHAHENWLQGRPIRVIRGSEFPLGDGSSQTYMPYTGFRYDGVYKVVQYKPRKGSQGNRVWQFAMRRCDSSPAPWTKKGHRWMKRHSPPFQQDHYHKRHKYWTFMRQVIDNLQPMTGYGNAERACKYIDKMQEVDERETTRSSSSILVAQMIRSVYIPPTKLRKAIIADTINRRIWMRVCDKNYQQHVGIHDYLSFIEVALTQPEFQCLVCNNQSRHAATKSIVMDYQFLLCVAILIIACGAIITFARNALIPTLVMIVIAFIALIV